jgi:hypothetical protein
MILHNLSKAIREQNYYAVAIEFIIVIAGVVIGFQINAWAEGREDRALEAVYLERLHADISCAAEGQDFNLGWDQGLVDAQQTVLDALRAGVLRPEDEAAFSRGLSTIGMHNPMRWRWGTVDELNATGNITLIRDPGLRDQLARAEADYLRFKDVVDEARAQVRLGRAKITDRFRPIEVGLNTGDPSRVDYDFAALAADAGFQAEFANLQVASQLIVGAGSLHQGKLEGLRAQLDRVRGVRLVNAAADQSDFTCDPQPAALGEVAP